LIIGNGLLSRRLESAIHRSREGSRYVHPQIHIQGKPWNEAVSHVGTAEETPVHPSTEYIGYGLNVALSIVLTEGLQCSLKVPKVVKVTVIGLGGRGEGEKERGRDKESGDAVPVSHGKRRGGEEEKCCKSI